MSRVQSNAVVGTNAALTATFPSVPTSGNRLIAFSSCLATTPAAATLTSAGWTLLGQVSIGTTSGTSDGTLSAWTKVAGASEPTAVAFGGAATKAKRAEVFEYGNVGSGSPTIGTPQTSAATNVSAALAAASGELAAAVGDTMVAGWGSATSTTGNTFDSGFTLGYAGVNLSSADLVVATAGTINPTLAWTSAAAKYGSLLVKIPGPPSGPPNFTTAPAITGTPAVGSVLTCDGGTVNQTVTRTYQWLSGGTAVGTGATYTIVSGNAGTTMTCVVTATNTTTSQSGTATSNGIAIPARPVNTTAPVIVTDGSPSTGETITVTAGAYTGTGITLTYQWFRNTTPITGQTATSYLLVVSDENSTITVQETATNGGGSITTVSSNTVVPPTSAPISDASFLYYYSGGAGNTDLTISTGGARGGTYPGTVDSLFGPIPGSVALAGGTLYAAVYVRNTNTVSTATNMTAYVENQFAAGTGLTLAVGVPLEAVNTALAATASRTTAPTGVTFTQSATSAGGLAFGNLAPNDYRGVWVRLTVAAGTAQTAAGTSDAANFNIVTG